MTIRWRIFTVVLLAVSAVVLWITRTHFPLPHAPARAAVGEQVTAGTGRQSTYYASGEGPCVGLHASAGREASDFNELVGSLNAAGFRTVAVEAGGIKGSHIEHAVTLDAAAENLRSAVRAACPDSGAVTLIGHAFGNRVVRSYAHLHPGEVERVVLLAAGGQRAIAPDADTALRVAFDSLSSHARRMAAVSFAFFAPGNDIPDHWTRGWHTQTAMTQGQAVATSIDGWQSAGGVPMLIVQPAQDRIAPPADTAELLQAQLGDQVEVVVIDDAGHALLPEQPDAVADAVLDYLSRP